MVATLQSIGGAGLGMGATAAVAVPCAAVGLGVGELVRQIQHPTKQRPRAFIDEAGWHGQRPNGNFMVVTEEGQHPGDIFDTQAQAERFFQALS